MRQELGSPRQGDSWPQPQFLTFSLLMKSATRGLADEPSSAKRNRDCRPSRQFGISKAATMVAKVGRRFKSGPLCWPTTD